MLKPMRLTLNALARRGALPRPTSSAIKRFTRGSRRLAERQQLIGVEPDVGTEWRPQKIAVGGARRTPTDRPQVRSLQPREHGSALA